MNAIFTKFFRIELFWRDLRCDGGRIDTRVETVVNNQSELGTGHIQQENKRRRLVQPSLCFNSECVDRIISWLDNDEVDTIGVYGMCGVGKTTLATQLETRLLNHDIRFSASHDVAGVSVGVNCSVYKLQQDIAGAFGIDLQGDEDKTRRASMIEAFFSRRDKCVLILDDLWGDFRRKDVGIPKECKLVLISQSLDVCRVLGCEKVLKVEPLSEGKTWKLFNHSIGGGVLNNEDVCRIRKLVYDKCAGLPLAIVELAKRLRKMVDDNGFSWREVLEGTNPFSSRSMHLEDTFSHLKLSYERLSDIKLQQCFLYSAIYPKGHAISREELIRVWIGEKLIDDISSLLAQYDKGHSILNKLINSCLLEACEDYKGCIKIHEVVRHMALSIAGDSFMIEAGVPSKFEFRENVRVVSLINSLISPIPSGASSKYHTLSTLLLQHNPLELIPESLFLQMRALRVLNLSDTRLIRLPSSIGALEELRVLDLSFCQNLKQVAALSKLLKLQFLNLSQTTIEKVPCSLEKLKRLTELNLSSIPEPTKIPSVVLLALCRLKKLTCHVIGTIHELQRMNSLEILDARFFSLCDLSAYVRSQHWCILESYSLQLGCEVQAEQPYIRRVSLQGFSLTGQEQYIVLPSNIQELYVDNCRGFRRLSDVMYPVAYQHKSCQNYEVFLSLEICVISRCPDVETLFAANWVENLQSLELLQVEDCGQLKEVITEEFVERGVYPEGISAPINLLQIRQLIFTRLPQMESIYKGQLVCASLLSCTFLDCPKLTRLPFSCMGNGEETFPWRLEWIEGEKKWWEMLEWDQPGSEALFKPLFRCKSLDDH